MAPVVLELLRRPETFRVRVVVTGQHREQLDQVLRVFEIQPDHDLAIMRHGQTLTDITARALQGLDADLLANPPIFASRRAIPQQPLWRRWRRSIIRFRLVTSKRASEPATPMTPSRKR